jgi:hypothetical protein
LWEIYGSFLLKRQKGDEYIYQYRRNWRRLRENIKIIIAHKESEKQYFSIDRERITKSSKKTLYDALNYGLLMLYDIFR